jgi:hypothetical protein
MDNVQKNTLIIGAIALLLWRNWALMKRVKDLENQLGATIPYNPYYSGFPKQNEEKDEDI